MTCHGRITFAKLYGILLSAFNPVQSLLNSDLFIAEMNQKIKVRRETDPSDGVNELFWS